MQEKQNKGKRNFTYMVFGVFMGLLFLSASFYLFPQSQPNQSKKVVQKKVTELKSKDEMQITIPLKELTDTALYFSFKNKNAKRVRFFALFDKENIPHIAFDACEVCFAAKKGYRQEGNVTICNNCGNKYSVKAIGTSNKTGGCWPAYLPVRFDKENIVIDVSVLAEKQYLFP